MPTNIELIENKIYLIRGKKIMLDRDLANLYRVETKALNRAVRRNIKRFPEDFMFQLTLEETESMRYQFDTAHEEPALNKDESLRYQIGTLKRGQHIKYFPYAFTEQGVAMLSSVLRSDTAIEVNIQIMRTFTKLREMLAGNKELREKIEEMEKKYDQQFQAVFIAIKQLISPDPPIDEPKRNIGFRT